MERDDVSLSVSIARLIEQFKALDDRLKRVESIIYVTCGGALVGLAYAVLTHQIKP